MPARLPQGLPIGSDPGELREVSLDPSRPLPILVADQMLAVGPEDLEPYPYRADLPSLQIFLAELVADCPTREHAITRIRGAQAGFFLHGILLTVPALLGSCTGYGLIARLPHCDADRIRTAVAHPVHAAALATALLTGLNARILGNVRIDSLSEDGSTLAITVSVYDGANPSDQQLTYSIPSYGRSLLAAARTFHLLDGKQPTDLLLEDGIGRRNRRLIETARICALTVPSIAHGGTTGIRPWHGRTHCWIVGKPVHDARRIVVPGWEKADRESDRSNA
ncbi:hypothetical protein GCM10023194_57180 [Planotetraspora phitsanulokensis]|uniref:Uncharacterized protein n=1 Tax=Planotetraspora phitsanulokensis TaxID=575192 RepID=A0A8J3UE32_9ACTN|nr:hypothetical protein Pph01_80780 [Planotetraspora phitsanulokensis]